MKPDHVFGSLVLGVLCALSGCGGGGGDVSSATLGALKVLSNRADLVSGGDALVEWVPAPGADPASAVVTVGGRDVSSAFSLRANGRYMGVVTGLADGPNTLTVKAATGATASTTIVNHFNGGPLIYGPQAAPIACDSGASDAKCNRPVKYSFFYKSKDPAKTNLLPYDSSAPPSDIATTTTDSGASVPFIVRLETGVIDRDYYNIAVLWNPAESWQPWAPQTGWNSKVVFMHGRGLGASYRQLGTITGEVIQNTYALSKGFAVASTALNDNGHNVNIALQAEAMIMLKERLIENYGEIRYSIGQGGSGGAIAQQWVANAYPGIYDGLILSASFPDSGTTAVEIEDCGLLGRYFSDSSHWAPGVSWPTAQRLAVQGSVGDSCGNWIAPLSAVGIQDGFTRVFDPSHHGVTAFPGTSPTVLGGCDLADALTYNAVFNPTGVRCSIQDYVVGIMGRRPSDGFANRPYSNVGVQFGLSALKAGTITAEQFVDLNANLGSHNIDYVFQPARTSADVAAVDAAYRSGWVNSGNGMSQVAILDVRSPDTSSIHHQFRSWAMRARIDKAQGHHDNQVIWYNSGKSDKETLDAMDAWLASAAKANGATRAERIVAGKPSTISDICGSRSAANLSMLECTGVSDASPRVVAGGPVSDDVLDCKLKPLDRSSYGVSFTDAQWSRMQAAFPSGACDYSQVGNGQQRTTLWQTYLNADGTVHYGGVALPAASD